jgi:hypothetical protein
MISVVIPPADKVEGVNLFEILIASTFSRAAAGVAFVSPCCVWIELAGILFVYAP